MILIGSLSWITILDNIINIAFKFDLQIHHFPIEYGNHNWYVLLLSQ